MNMDSYFANEEYCRSIKQRALFIGLPVFLLIVGYIVYKMRNLSKTSMIINQIEKQPLILNRKVLAFGIITLCIYLIGLIFKKDSCGIGCLICNIFTSKHTFSDKPLAILRGASCRIGNIACRRYYKLFRQATQSITVISI